MKSLVYIFTFFNMYRFASSEIRSSAIVNKLIKIKPVGGELDKSFVPLSNLPSPHKPALSGRRHYEEDCSTPHPVVEVHEGPTVDIHGDYYDHFEAKTVATVIIPDHIDQHHFEVTTQVPYLTVGPIEAIGYHPSTVKSLHPSECEKIYQEHLDQLYSEESSENSEESLEMARMPLMSPNVQFISAEPVDKLYSDMELK